MINPICVSKLNNNVLPALKKPASNKGLVFRGDKNANAMYPLNSNQSVIRFNTKLNNSEQKQYNFLLNQFKDYPISKNADGLSVNQQLDVLLKNGKLLSKSNDGSTMLDNLNSIVTTKRAENLDPKLLVSNILDVTTRPRIVTQKFGDIPTQEVAKILEKLPDGSPLKRNPGLMNVTASGTCAAASIEVNLADKYPAEFTRLINGLSSKNKAVHLDIDLSSLNSKNTLEAISYLNLFQLNVEKSDLKKARIKITTDDNAYIRANIQSKYWDEGERTVVDVLAQSAIMQTGSQNSYDSLTDIRTSQLLSPSNQGLVESEKTLVESLLKNKEVSSLVYLLIDDNQNIVGRTCPAEETKKHIIQAIDSGDDVIIGSVDTNESSGKTNSNIYNKAIDGEPNKVINGHEITIVGYRQDQNGQTQFDCVDTDDDSSELVTYSSAELIPRLHHAGYSAKLVEKDEPEITKKLTA